MLSNGDLLSHLSKPVSRYALTGDTGPASTRSEFFSLCIATCRKSGLYLDNYYGGGSGQIWLDHLDCTGNEVSVDDCTHNEWGVLESTACTHKNDVSIICDNSTCHYISLTQVNVTAVMRSTASVCLSVLFVF